MTTQPRLTRRNLLKCMMRLLDAKSLKWCNLKYQGGYEAALKDLADAFKLNMKDMEGKQ